MKRLLFASLCLGLLAFAVKAEAANPVVVMETSKGTIKIELFADKAPITVKNFLNYVDDKFYDGTTFHRVIPDFMIQGGGFTPGLTQAKSGMDVQALEKKTREPIKNEAATNGLHNEARHDRHGADQRPRQRHVPVLHQHRGQQQEARSGRRQPDGYCVFGKVIEGMDVVDKIKDVQTTEIVSADRMADVPAEDVIIKSVRRADK